MINYLNFFIIIMTELYPLGLKINHLITVNFCAFIFDYSARKQTCNLWRRLQGMPRNQQEEYTGHPAEYFMG